MRRETTNALLAGLCAVLVVLMGCGSDGSADSTQPGGVGALVQGGAQAGVAGSAAGTPSAGAAGVAAGMTAAGVGAGLMAAGVGAGAVAGTTAGTTAGAAMAGMGGDPAGAEATGGVGAQAGMMMAGAGATGGTQGPPPSGDWGTADPAMRGTFSPMTEQNVGPGNGFTLVRPVDLESSGKAHPLITWGNGTGTTPRVYAFLLDHLASHGFVVIASNDMNVAQGTPPLMVQGVNWVLEQNADPSSALYQRIDTENIGATGHSQGAFASSTAAADPNIRVWAPIQGAARVNGQHGPGLLLCGGMDTVVPCSGARRTFDAINDLPVMYAELVAATHTNWFGGFGMVHPYVVAVTGWMRVHLMGDTELRSMFYGPSCSLCGDSAWVIDQKMLD